ncbi:hypothetical protein O7606_04130 [Micromonospora sp. WMMD882]|uniref:hypothetical protein n=1 Tax=Micromonospora sp. WMMD882 TaxID=3015151 RepID=UPI00248C20E7|nr:hypothetical protein [Micromonospora sp. WMMD882]WBB80585.1 hypothetical protein O7606_04130 [Micromonospora sp. WMMD882]
MVAVRRSTKRLLSELDALAYPDRMVTLAHRVRALADSGDLPEVLADLRAGDTYHRFLAVTAGQVVGDRAGVLAAVDDPDRSVRAAAVRAGLRAGWLSAADLAGLLRDASADLRRLVYRTLRRLRRADLADALVDEVRRGFGDAEAAALLPVCAPGHVGRLLPDLAHAVGNWKPLARRHGETLLAYAETTLADLGPARRAGWWTAHGPELLTVARRHPGRVLDLLERHVPADRLPGDLVDYGPLAAVAPRRLLALLTAPARAGGLTRRRLPRALLRRLGRLPWPDLVELARRLRRRPDELRRLLLVVPPADRGALYDAAHADVDTDRVPPNPALVAALPYAWREREARRALTLDVVRLHEASVRTWSALLPWPEASAALAPALRAADPQDRSAGWTLLLAAARRSGDPAVVAEAVARLPRLRNEQDPVRAAAVLGATVLVPLLRADSVDALTQLTVDATTARDASPGTLSALGALATRVLAHHLDEPALVGWALDTLDRLFGGHRLPPLGQFDRTLRRGQEALVLTRLGPWIEAGLARGNAAPLFAVTRALGRRAHQLPDLQELLRRATRPGNVSDTVRRAVGLWLADPSTRDQRVAQVLADDPSTITLDVVWRAVSARRTDLLDRVLTGPPPAGAFLTAGTRWIPGPPERPGRWLPRQRQAYVSLQARLVADAGTPLAYRAAALRAAAQVPDAGRDLVLRYVDSANVTLAEAALGALPWTDRPEEALPVLLAHADTDRARVALYSAGRAARFVRPSALLAPLSTVALGRGKVTSRKEALRLLGRFGPAEAMPVLVSAWQQPDQHRDVRTAVVAAARQRLAAPESWIVLDEAVHAGREQSVTVLATSPDDVPVPDRPRYAALVARACASPDRQVARFAWSRLGPWLPWPPDLGTLVTAALTDLTDPHLWPSLRPFVGALLDHPDRPERTVLDAALRALVHADETDPEPGGPAADRPARRRMEAVLGAAADWAASAEPQVDRAPVREAARELGRRSAYRAGAAGLLTALVRLDDDTADQLTADLLEITALVEDRPALAANLAARLAAHCGQRTAGAADPTPILDTARRLAARHEAAAGLFAVALAGRGKGYGWSEPWRELVHELRRHPVADVRDAAFAITMARS